jgi:hypothetical protein
MLWRMTVDTHKPRIDRWPLPDNVINTGVLPARHPALQVLAAHRQREYWQATGETMPEIVDDMMAALDAAGESVRRRSSRSYLSVGEQNCRRKGRKGRKPPILRK